MKIETLQVDQGSLIRVLGRVDTTNYTDFEAAFIPLLQAGKKNILLDCSGLNYISSTGLRVLLTVQKRMTSAAGKFLLFAMQPNIREIFDISGFSSIFSILETEEQAIKAL